MKYAYERPFRLKILALLLDNIWTMKYGLLLIKSEYFEQDDEESIAKSLLDFHKAYGHCPVDPDDIIALSSNAYAEVVYRIFDLHEEGDNELASTKVIEFAKQQAMKLSVLEAVEDIERSDYTKIIDRFKESMQIGEGLRESGLDPIGDVDSWIYSYWSDRVRTGIYHLDLALDGGLGVPELGVIVGPPNQGKSMALINIGCGAAEVGSAKNVIHFTHEMKTAQVAKRYAARMLFRFPKRDDELDVYADDLINVAKRFYPGKIRIIGGSKMTFEEVESHLDRLIDDGFEPGLIIDDYADLMLPRRKYNERRFELSSIYEDWREISEKYKVPVWTATQANRSSLSKEIISMQDVAEDIGKAAIADTMIALCQTYEEKGMERARLFIAKLRDGAAAQRIIDCKWFTDSQAIISLGFARPKTKDKARDA